MKKDIEWLKKELDKSTTDFNGRELSRYEMGRLDGYTHATMLLDELDEPEKVVVPQFVADWIEEKLPKSSVGTNTIEDKIYIISRLGYGNGLNTDTLYQGRDYEFNNKLNRDLVKYVSNNKVKVIRALINGYEVEKELLWEIPIPDLVTSAGHIQYLTYDPKAKTYFASRQNGRLKQTFNAKDLASVPGQYRRYAELCDFKKIEEVTEWSWTE